MSKVRAGCPKRLRFFPPWFVSRDVYEQMQELLPSLYHHRFRFYFDRYGCIRCKRKNIMYGCSGLCVECLPLIEGRLKQIDKEMRRIHDSSKNPPAQRFLAGREKARELLADLRNP
jgi:hypothetical protein